MTTREVSRVVRVLSPHCGLAPVMDAGGGVYERELLKAMAAAGARFEILLPLGRPVEDVPGWNVRRILSPVVGPAWWADLAYGSAVDRSLRRGTFDLVRAHSVRLLGPACLRAAGRHRIPCVVHHHHLDPDPHGHRVERPVLRAARRVVLDSEFAREQIADVCPDRDHMRIVRPGVSPHLLGPAPSHDVRANLGIGPGRIVLHLGKLTPRKNLGCLVRVFADLAATRPDLRLVLAGTGPARADLLRQAREAGVAPRVHLVGLVSEEDKHALLAAAEVFAFPSVLEGFGLAPAEAMAASLPPVAFRTASLPEVVPDGEGGFLVPPGDERAFAGALAAVLDDPALRAELGRRGRAHVRERFTWERAAEDCRTVYEEAMKA